MVVQKGLRSANPCVNKKVDKKFIEQLKKHVEKNPTMSIKKIPKVVEVDEKTARTIYRLLGSSVLSGHRLCHQQKK